MKTTLGTTLKKMLYLPVLGIMISCGGSKSSAPTPPPVATNTPPVLKVDLNNSAPDEGQPFTIDARSSSDAENDNLTFSITQTGGISAPENMADAIAGLWTYNVPELSTDENLAFKIDVSDGVNTVSETITVTATNIVLTPVSALISRKPELSNRETIYVGGTAGPDIILDDTQGYRKIMQFSESYTTEIVVDKLAEDSNELGITHIARNGYGTADIDSRYGLGVPVGSKAELYVSHLGYSSYAEYGYILSVQEGDKVITAVQPSEGAPYYRNSVIEIESPCATTLSAFFDVETGSDYRRQTGAYDSTYGDLVIASAGNGIVVYSQNAKLSGSSERDIGKFGEKTHVVTSKGTYCYLGNTYFADTPGAQRRPYLLGIDYDTGILSGWVTAEVSYRAGQPDTAYIPFDTSEDAFEKVDLRIPEGLDIVDATSRTYYDRVSKQHSVIFALAVSDGQHNGDHRIITYSWRDGQNPKSDGVRQEFEWSKGVPTDIILTDLKPDSDSVTPDIVAVLGTVPYFAVIPNTISSRSNDPYAFSGLEYAESVLGMSKFLDANNKLSVPSQNAIYEMSLTD